MSDLFPAFHTSCARRSTLTAVLLMAFAGMAGAQALRSGSQEIQISLR